MNVRKNENAKTKTRITRNKNVCGQDNPIVNKYVLQTTKQQSSHPPTLPKKPPHLFRPATSLRLTTATPTPGRTRRQCCSSATQPDDTPASTMAGVRGLRPDRGQCGHDNRMNLSLCVFIFSLFSLFIFICLFNCRSRSGFVVAMVVGMWHDLSPLGVPLGRARARGQG